MRMKGKCLCSIGVLIILIGNVSTSPSPILPRFTTVINRITNNTIGVLHGVTGVVQGGLNMLSSTILRIADGADSARNKIIKILEEFRKAMMKGIPELGIPILEPLTIDRVELNIASPKIGKLHGYAADIDVRRLSEFHVDYVNWNRSILKLNVTFPRIDVKGEYAISGEIGRMVKIYGDGLFWLKIKGLKINIKLQIKYNVQHNPPLYIEDLKIGIKLKKLDNQFSNLMNGTELGQLFNEVISNITPEAMDMIWPELEPGISQQITRIINEKLKVFQLSTVVGRLLNVFSLNQGRIKIHT